MNSLIMGESNGRYKEAAISIARQLCRDAVWHNGACNWLSTYRDPENENLLYTRSCNEYFYEGSAGIAFFLTKIASLTDDTIIKETAKGALWQVINNREATGIGFYTGLTGLAFVMDEAIEVFKEVSFSNRLREFFEQLRKLKPEDCSLDVAEGIAGAIPVLARLEKKYKDKSLYEFIVSLAEYLLQKRNEHEFGWSWHTLDDTSNDLTGFGHGASGIAHAFACMYQYSREKKYAAAAERAFAYEDHYFQQEEMNWPDFRRGFAGTGRAVCSLAWCHGAPGIGMARLFAGKTLQQHKFISDALTAADTTAKYSSMETLGNFSLCHGLTGNTEFLMECSGIAGNKDYGSIAAGTAEIIIDHYLGKKIPLPGGVGTRSETPGFMTGNAGIGYFLLRMHSFHQFPSILMFS